MEQFREEFENLRKVFERPTSNELGSSSMAPSKAGDLLMVRVDHHRRSSDLASISVAVA
jgi:hypothetical protein